MTRFLNSQPSAGVSGGVETEQFVFAVASALDPQTNRRAAEAETVEDEARLVFARLAQTLGEAGCTLRDVVKTTVYLSDFAHQGAMRSVYMEQFEEGRYPARCTFALGLAGDCRVQIDAIAVQSGS